MNEEVLLFGPSRALVGIMTDPPHAARRQPLLAVILINAGLVHRVGPNRLYVKLARGLAALGCVVLRFDLSGLGDSTVRDDHLPFNKSAISETRAAMDALRAARGVEHFLLSGLCSGATIALTTAYGDPRVVGVMPINARTHHLASVGEEEVADYIHHETAARSYWTYWKTAVFRPNLWRKAMTGHADYRAMVRWTIRTLVFPIRRKVAWKRVVAARAQQAVADLHTLTERGVRLLFVYSAGDPGLDYCRVMLGNTLRTLTTEGKVRLEIIPQADHTFTLLRNQDALLHAMCTWVAAMMQDNGCEAEVTEHTAVWRSGLWGADHRQSRKAQGAQS
jgi:pimeloyl-ACP methyl ester carboxylesterase